MSNTHIAHAIEDALGTMKRGPRPFSPELEHASKRDGERLTQSDVARYLESPDLELSDAVKRELTKALQAWDADFDKDWIGGTGTQTLERRRLIYGKLELEEGLAFVLNRDFMPYIRDEPTLPPISRKHEIWYGMEPPLSTFYWDSYKKYLEDELGWPTDGIGDMDERTTRILERLSNPCRKVAYQAKGLVMGYVQSGKTANFTGLIAKSVDAGYRLIIVLAGTVNLLRYQTQRRIDKELIGVEYLYDDYEQDDELSHFLKRGTRSSNLGQPDWTRLTGPDDDDDYTPLGKLITSLEFSRVNIQKPFYHIDNLRSAPIRIMVIKKSTDRLKNIIGDLSKIETELAEIPTLIIDDESDLASINTIDPAKVSETTKATKTLTNKLISDLLRLLPRAQYVGYTATPTANAFIDPADAADLFPKDFIISLTRPRGYMGAREFHDLDYSGDEAGPNQRAYVRDVLDEDEKESNLLQAIDSYVLSGAIKLFRSDKSKDLNFKHHTMLVHDKHTQASHEAMKVRVNQIFDRAGYYDGTSFPRLKRLWETDFREVCLDRSGDLTVPDSFSEIEKYISLCIGKVDDGEGPTIIVNGSNSDPNFNGSPIWKIVSGGNKLSRGFTIEGLTISYFRRKPGSADTLMQMGRWFGFRRGYQDLVRLYVGRAEPPGGKKKTDLYAALEANCQDEEALRKDIEKYTGIGIDPPMTPAKFAPYISASGPLRATSSNKMFNARIISQNFGGDRSESTTAPSKKGQIAWNGSAMRSLLEGVEIQKRRLGFTGTGRNPFDTYLGILEPEKVIEFVKGYEWSEAQTNHIYNQIRFMEGEHGDPGIDRWVFMAPQIGSELYDPWQCESVSYRTVGRSRVATGSRFRVYSDSGHRDMAGYLAGQNVSGRPNNPAKRWLRQKQGTFLFYPVQEIDAQSKKSTGQGLTMGFSLLYPPNDLPKEIKWGVHIPDLPDEAPIDRVDSIQAR
jgi:hypothetical protein